MKIILRESVEKLGQIGDVVTVKNGYARNYLIPRSLAYFATPKALKAIELEKIQYAKKQEREKVIAEGLAAKLNELQISIPMKAGDENKLYGSVSSQMIANELAEKGFDIDKRHIMLEEAIKSLGVFDVKVRLHSEVVSNLKVWVINEEE
ncbi:MAG: 50S ribosomal protein L9 [Ignavibacteria bacterium]|nr:50S ribosomal protein L9 [Ignavibacteria bacterium]